MKTILSQDHTLHAPSGELSGGIFVQPYERPERIDYIVDALAEAGFPTPISSDTIDMTPVQTIHDAGYLSFLETAWDDWRADGYQGDVIATSFPTRGMQQHRPPKDIDGKAGYYCMAAETAITQGTWTAAKSSCASAQTAQRLVAAGARAAFALCRPPGHHASKDQFGGYCFFNNAAVAAQMFRDDGVGKVAVLDIDFHHGNGTQDIFYARNDVFFASLHGHPEDEFPYFLGWADETGVDAGEGCNLNIPLRPETNFQEWSQALETAFAAIQDFGAQALVISLGVDAYEKDPISSFKLGSADFTTTGQMIESLGLPTLFVMEGGYAIAEVGTNTVNLLRGFEHP